MEFIITFIVECLLEISQEATKSAKVPRLIRILLTSILAFLFISVEGLLLFLGFKVFIQNSFAGIFIIGIALIFLYFIVREIKSVYKSIKKDAKR